MPNAVAIWFWTYATGAAAWIVWRLAASAFALLLLAGCSTVTRGTKDKLRVESVPSGAAVNISSGQTGTTPAMFKLPRAKSVTVTVSLADYATTNVFVKRVLSGAGGAGFAGNVVLGGVVGAVIDLGSGALYDLKPNPVRVTLEKLPTNSITNSLGISTKQ